MLFNDIKLALTLRKYILSEVRRTKLKIKFKRLYNHLILHHIVRDGYIYYEDLSMYEKFCIKKFSQEADRLDSKKW